jgi:hypothetical protein
MTEFESWSISLEITDHIAAVESCSEDKINDVKLLRIHVFYMSIEVGLIICFSIFLVGGIALTLSETANYEKYKNS